MMKILKKALFAFLLAPLFSFAQSNYKTGYVVTLKGDTIHGFIDYREWDSNPNAINFKATADNKTVQSFTPADIVYFNVDDLEAYQTYTGKISTDPTNIDNPSSRDTSSKIATVFLKILQKGKNLELFSYTDRIKSRFYIGETPGYNPVELAYHIYTDPAAQNLARGIVTDNTYMKQLFALANKYDAMDSQLEKIFQTEQYMGWYILKIVSKINKISESDYKKSGKGNSAIMFFASAALNITNISPGTPSAYFGAGGKSSTSFGPSVGLGISISPNPNTGKLQLRVEANVNTASYNSLYENKVEPYIGVKASFNDLITAFAGEIIYNFYNSENLKFYAGVGLIFEYNSYSNAFFGPYSFINNQTAFVGKAGVQFSKKWEFFIDYVSSTYLTDAGYFQLSSSRERIGINYLFK